MLSRKSLWAYCWTLSVTSDPSTLSQLPSEQIYKEKKLCDTGKSAWCIKWACAMVRWPYVIEINTCNGSVYHFWPYSDQIMEKVLGGIFSPAFAKCQTSKMLPTEVNCLIPRKNTLLIFICYQDRMVELCQHKFWPSWPSKNGTRRPQRPQKGPYSANDGHFRT